MGNLKTFQIRFIELRRAIFADGLDEGVPFLVEDIEVLAKRLGSEGPSFARRILPLLGKALDKGLVQGNFKCPEHFALRGKSQIPKLFWKCFAQIFDDEGVLRFDPPVQTIKYLRQMLLLDSKLLQEPSPEQESEAFSGFCQRMRTLRGVRVPRGNPIVEGAKALLTEVLRKLDLTDIKPGHGPGGVAEGKEADEKWDFRSWPSQANKYYPFFVYGVSNLDHLREISNDVIFRKEETTKICLVPKDFKGPRLISAEPASQQFLQQGQMRRMMRYMENHSLISRSITLRDQEPSRVMAQKAVSSNWATVDLSNASDTVSATLVWYLLSELPKLRRLLFCTRSQYAEYKGVRERIIAFAPMGSGNCFPVESLVFWALAMASIRLHRSEYCSPKKDRYLDWYSVAREVRVFGDDLIVPNDSSLPALLGALRDVGCEPNMGKTCFDTPFREACGSEWFAGLDVTVIRNKKFQYAILDKFSEYPVLLDLQRKFFLRGFRKTACLLKEYAREILPVYTLPLSFFERFGLLDVRLVDSYPCCLGDYASHDAGLKVRWNKDLFRLEARLPVFRQKYREWATCGYSRLNARIQGDFSDRVVLRGGNTRLAWSSLPYPVMGMVE